MTSSSPEDDQKKATDVFIWAEKQQEVLEFLLKLLEEEEKSSLFISGGGNTLCCLLTILIPHNKRAAYVNIQRTHGPACADRVSWQLQTDFWSFWRPVKCSLPAAGHQEPKADKCRTM